ncbi:MAG: TetR/AcrR family transcriptional regulator [Acidobacteriia bacterium]|nr:TetR/AcrR family transcriptional regulator [Terriglobia bacterium]
MSGLRAPDPVLAERGPRRSRPRTQEKLANLLSVAAALIARRGYEQTAIRDVGRATGASLPGMYYYFKSKGDLLFQIQHRAFSSLLEAQEREFAVEEPPERKFRRLIVGHLAFYARHPNEMKVCTFELESVRDEAYREIEELRRRYYRLLASVVGELLKKAGREDPRRLASRHITLFVFGMLNWTLMWYDPQRDGPVENLGDEMADLVLPGLSSRKEVR